MKYYKPKYFKIYELIDPELYRIYGEKAWRFFDPRILYSIDQIRKFFKRKVTINNWYWNGNFQWRGLRTFHYKLFYFSSMHNFGRGLDFDVEGYTAEQVRRILRANQNRKEFRYISYVEDNVNWVHIDCRNSNKKGMYFFRVK